MYIAVLGIVSSLILANAAYIDSKQTFRKYNPVRGNPDRGHINMALIKELNKVYDECLRRKQISCENDLLTVEEKRASTDTPPANGLWGRDTSKKIIISKNRNNVSERHNLRNGKSVTDKRDLTEVDNNGFEQKNQERKFGATSNLFRRVIAPAGGGLWGREIQHVLPTHVLNERQHKVNPSLHKSNELLQRKVTSMPESIHSSSKEGMQLTKHKDIPKTESQIGATSLVLKQQKKSVRPKNNGLWGREIMEKSDKPNNKPKDRFNAGLWGRVLHFENNEMHKSSQELPKKVTSLNNGNLRNDFIREPRISQDRPWKWQPTTENNDFQTGLWGKDMQSRYKELRGVMWRRQLGIHSRTNPDGLRRGELNGKTNEMYKGQYGTKLLRRNMNIRRQNVTYLENTMPKRSEWNPRRLYLRHNPSPNV